MKIFSALFDAIIIPVAVVKDACTLGGFLTGHDKSATREQIEKVEEDLGL